MRIFPSVCKILTISILTGITSTHALEFEFINNGDIPLSEVEMHALKRAGLLWSDHFSDPVSIKINVEWKKETFFSSNAVLASVQIGRATAPAVMIRDSLLAEADTSEHSLLWSLPLPIPVSHTSMSMNDVSLTLANAKALGITPANDPHFGEALLNNADAHISFNLKHYGEFFFDQDRVEGDKYDFTGIAAHEIGHALGFTSVVDVQAMNPGVLLNPMLLDVFRFPGATINPSLALDSRQTLPGYAQFHDEMLTSAAFGSGFNYFDPVRCALPNHRCSASHWEDASANLMTSATKGKIVSIQSADVHALDRLGVDGTWRNGIPLIKVKAEFYDTASALPAYDKDKFSTKTEALPFSEVIPNFGVAPTHAFHISIDGHAGTGYAVFVPKVANEKIRAVNFQPQDAEQYFNEQWEVETPVNNMPDFPAHFSHFYFESKNSSYHFRFVSTFSNYGAIFDAELGAYGGFRISGFMDGELDGDFSLGRNAQKDPDGPQDYDATLTMVLLLQKPHNIEHGIANVPFAIQWQDKRVIQDNILHLIDNSAFDAPTSYNNSSSYKDAWEKRVNQLLGDPEPGRDIAL